MSASAIVERQHLHDFQLFYDRLADRRDIVYLFFTGGLLHWVDRCLSWVPEDVNLVLLGAALAPEEKHWVETSSGRPFHHIRLPADDKTVWEFLFETNRRNFGWLDIDCFVLNSGLFREVAAVGEETSANCVWTFPSRTGLDVVRTYFIFLNVEAVKEVRERYGVSPCTYAYSEGRKGRTAPYGRNRLLTPEVVERIATVLPPDSRGRRPPFLTERDYYDTLQVYQLLARSLGYRVHKVRSLTSRSSDEIVHVGKVSYYNWGWEHRRLPENREIFASIAQADFAILGQACERLPAAYRERWREMARELPTLGIPTDRRAVREGVVRSLARVGMGREAAARLMSRLGA